MSTGSLSTLMDALRARGGSWSSSQDVGADRATVTAAWAASEDPFAMLLLLAALRPERDVPTCDALVAGMAFFAPMRREAERQARSRPGMNYNGPDRFRFVHLAQRIRHGLAELPALEQRAAGARLSGAIRSIVPDPYALASVAVPGRARARRGRRGPRRVLE